MANAFRTNTSLPLGARLGEIKTAAAEAYAAWRVYRITLAELRQLSPRELADLGMNPSIIRRVALEAAYGKDI